VTGRPSIAWKSIGVAALPNAGGTGGFAIEDGFEHLFGVADFAVGGEEVDQLADGLGLGRGLERDLNVLGFQNFGQTHFKLLRRAINRSLG
jgi:hypothetical protein